jgi:[protein-PII] uridylyltransferase
MTEAMNNGPESADRARELQALIKTRMDEIRTRHDHGASGVVVCRAISDLADEVVRTVYASCREESRDPSARGGLALVALGGYGRSQLNPQSDVDLLFLHPGKLNPGEEQLIECALPMLWDAGLRVGHSVRSIEECLGSREPDMDTYTALVESRIVTGNQMTYVRFRDALDESLRDHIEWFVDAKVTERRDRLAESAGSVLLLEPNVKESPGGLRDYHTIVWLATALFGSSHPSLLRDEGFLASSENDRIAGAVDFLLRVRNGLHFTAGSAQDQVQFRMTDALARNLGYGRRPDQKPEDALMQDYYRHAANLRSVADAAERRAAARARGGEPGTRDLGNGFFSRGGELFREPSTADAIRSEPGVLLEAFRLAAENDLLPHPALRDGIEEAVGTAGESAGPTENQTGAAESEAGVIDDAFRSSAQRRDQFLAVLGSGGAVAGAVRAMYDTGVLTAVLPELRGMYRLGIDDLYHRFTVDGHTLICLGMLDALRSGSVEWGSSEAKKLGDDLLRAVRGVGRYDLLRLALLFHDAGKGYGSRHSERGAALFEDVAGRWEMNPEDRGLVHFLVEKHLLLTDVAYRRDPEDREVIRSLAEEVGDPERAATLLALTLADIMGVAPGTLSEWKIVLLWRLYRKLVDALEGRMQVVAEGGEVREGVISRLAERFGEDTVRRHLELMPPNYLVYANEDHVIAHLDLLDSYDREAARVTVRPVDLVEAPDSEGEPESCLEVHICTEDRLGLFRDIVRACERENFEVNSARIFTRRDGIVVDTIVAVNRLPESDLDESRMELLQSRLLRDLDPKRKLRRRMAPLAPAGLAATPRGPESSERIRSQSQVKASSEISGAYSVIEFRHQDEPRLLAHVAEFLTDHDLDIQYARIYHEGRRIVGAFHVTGADGEKITDIERLEGIERELSEALEAHQAVEEAPGPPGE